MPPTPPPALSFEKHQPFSTETPLSPYHGAAAPYRDPAVKERSKLNPKTWTWKTRALVAVTIIVVIVAATVGGVLGARANAYPDYSRIEYSLKDTYEGDSFFDQFDYFTGYDPTHGFVHYVDAAGSEAQNLTSVSTSKAAVKSLSDSNPVMLKVDTEDQNATTGRKSVRITSKQTYNTGLFIFDVLHSPYGCATWPALWLVDESNWPKNGEIDVMEAVNVGDTGNQMTLHTSDGCNIGKHRKRKQTGEAISYNCFGGANDNEGCAVTGAQNTFGQAFNEMGGGIYAMELRAEGIRTWLFNRDSIPQDITDQQPDPSTWGTALADFPNLECDISSHFKNQSIVANINLCGDWAGQDSVFQADGKCSGTCTDFVANEASSFEKAYWEFGGFWVYQGAS